jgi:hypothetical protein
MRSALVMIAACGDPLITRDFRGEPLFSIEGRVVDIRYNLDSTERLEAAISWSLTGDTTTDPLQIVEQSSVATSVTFPATFKINIFEAPTDPRLYALDRYFVGELMVYEDTNGDRTISPGEIRGGASSSAVLFAAADISKESSPTGGPLPKGFTQVNLPLPCEVIEPSPFTGGETCGVELGAPCTAHADCGSGECLTTDGYVSFPGGYCALPATPDGCVPENGVFEGYYLPQDVEPPDDRYGYYFQRCDSNVDCRDQYECYTYVGACFPKLPVFIEIYPDFIYQPLCAQAFDGPV